MKLRIKGNSIRLRLTKTEIANLGDKGFVEEAIHFLGGSKLVYRIESFTGDDDLSAELNDHQITVKIPDHKTRDWVSTELVGLQATQVLGNEEHAGAELKILIEKDFACLKPREGEDDSDAYPHPEEGTLNC